MKYKQKSSEVLLGKVFKGDWLNWEVSAFGCPVVPTPIYWKGLSLLHCTSFFKLKYSWRTILYQFQAYYTVIWHLHTLWNDHHDNSSKHLSPYKVIIMLLTIFHMLYITSPWLIYFISEGLYFLIPFSYFASPTSSLLATTHLFSVSVSLFLFGLVYLFCFLDPLYFLCSFVKDQLPIFVWIYFCALYSVPLIYLSFLLWIPYCLDNCNFTVILK